MTLLTLTAGLQRVVHFFRGPPASGAGAIQPYRNFLYLVMPSPEFFFGALLGCLGEYQSLLSRLDFGQQAGLILGVVGQSDGGEVQHQPIEIIAGRVVKLGRQVFAFEQRRSQHLAQLLLPARPMVAQKMPQTALSRVTLNQQLVKRSEERRVGKECRTRWPPYH